MKIAQIGEQVLREHAESVAESDFNTPQLKEFVEQLLQTMLSANGVGIAAPQVFDPRAIMIIASRPNKRYPDAPQMAPMILVNPRIMRQNEQLVGAWEGCLSVPGLRGYIRRSDAVDVEYFNILGERCQASFEGFTARIFLHEFDHLIGQTWLDHVSDTTQIMAESVWAARFLSD